MEFKSLFRYAAIFISCMQLYSCSCVIRTYAPFSECTPALEDSGEVQVGGTVNLIRGEINATAALVNHFAVSASLGGRIPLSARWACSDWKTGIGYFGRINETSGYEIFAGYGQVHFRNLRDTIMCNKFYLSRYQLMEYVHTNIDYNCFYIKPDIWVKSGSSKFILSLGFKYLATEHFNFYQQEYYEDADSLLHIDFTKEYHGNAEIALLEPAVQFRTGKALNFFLEAKFLAVVKENIQKDIYFDSPKSVLSAGIVYNFKRKRNKQPSGEMQDSNRE
jgi:hypothetical protein